jgi:hypothetical protein
MFWRRIYMFCAEACQLPHCLTSVVILVRCHVWILWWGVWSSIFKCRIRLCAETVQQITMISRFLRKGDSHPCHWQACYATEELWSMIALQGTHLCKAAVLVVNHAHQQTDFSSHYGQTYCNLPIFYKSLDVTRPPGGTGEPLRSRVVNHPQSF